MIRNWRGYPYLRHLWRAPHHAFYHPHQRIWNLYTSALMRPLKLESVLVAFDTFVLALEAVYRRASLLGLRRLGTLKPIAGKIVYLDLGLHTEAIQLRQVLNWLGDWPNFIAYGFEAHPGYAEQCRKRFANDARVHLFNFALVGPGHGEDTVMLHLADPQGYGNSLFAARGEEKIAVQAIRLSDFLKANGVLPGRDVILLRMNIEGAEHYVIEDLLDAGIAGQIDGYYGTWDDPFKIDPQFDVTFRRLLKRARVRSFPFCDRDTEKPAGSWRKKIIRYDILTSIYHGIERKPLSA